MRSSMRRTASCSWWPAPIWAWRSGTPHDPGGEPPLDTYAGMCTQGEKELDLLAACEQQIAFLHGVESRALVRFARLRPGEWGEMVSRYVADEIGVAAKWTTRYANSR